jgi:DNA-binding winged helix-turn-helix (wHTH) protein
LRQETPSQSDPRRTPPLAPLDGSNGDMSYEFGPFQLDGRTRLLSREGKRIRLTPKVSDVLFALVEAHGQLIEKDQLMRVVWPDSFVLEGNLTQTVSILRKALGEHPDSGEYIETIPTRGYRFAATIRRVGDEKPSSVQPSQGHSPAMASVDLTRGSCAQHKRRNTALAALILALVAGGC